MWFEIHLLPDQAAAGPSPKFAVSNCFLVQIPKHVKYSSINNILDTGNNHHSKNK